MAPKRNAKRKTATLLSESESSEDFTDTQPVANLMEERYPKPLTIDDLKVTPKQTEDELWMLSNCSFVLCSYPATAKLAKTQGDRQYYPVFVKAGTICPPRCGLSILHSIRMTGKTEPQILNRVKEKLEKAWCDPSDSPRVTLLLKSCEKFLKSTLTTDGKALRVKAIMMIDFLWFEHNIAYSLKMLPLPRTDYMVKIMDRNQVIDYMWGDYAHDCTSDMQGVLQALLGGIDFDRSYCVYQEKPCCSYTKKPRG